MSQAVLDTERGNISDKSIRNLEAVLAVSRHSSLLVNDLLEVTTLTNGKPKMKKDSVSLQAVASGVIDMSEYRVVRTLNSSMRYDAISLIFMGMKIASYKYCLIYCIMQLNLLMKGKSLCELTMMKKRPIFLSMIQALVLRKKRCQPFLMPIIKKSQKNICQKVVLV